MFTKVLIANRGEIAVRVIRTCRELGIATVAVYSDLDRDALHVRLADEAYALGGQTAAESYLNTEAILDAIARSGADAVHPGYGFFSENTDFARAITDRGRGLHRPAARGHRGHGRQDQLAAGRRAGRRRRACPARTEVLTDGRRGRRLRRGARLAGGHQGRLRRRRAGHAGRRSRPTRRPPRSSRPRARRSRASGAAECYLERYLTWPRHIEMQVFADTHGNAVWLGERDCSAQRRHQKLIEESPAPDFPDEVRQAMGEAAVKVAKACGYVNAGTVEFLYQDGEFYFLEMNTRLQVEHPVTELVTGLDLVELQLRVAAGEPLPFTQDDIERRGHAIEVPHQRREPGRRALPAVARHDHHASAGPTGSACASTPATTTATPSASTTTTSSPSSSCGAATATPPAGA